MLGNSDPGQLHLMSYVGMHHSTWRCYHPDYDITNPRED